MKSLKISIIIPNFNNEKYIARCLESCIAQSYKNIEFIVVDDKSTDKSREVIESFAKLDDRIHPLYNESNMGTFASRNNGVIYANRSGGGGYTSIFR
ncbi:glycosyltransferase family 2 protein [Helicobacter sp. MIT 05-5293]|uniref:glycosyltransferase family A protein n=1 Tax=Helicobacter sp. MIT 05-5293 TaxID=1548149 RepID=UPI0010FDEDCC|nr:glycosyltransferase family A protein [Helicobacter sp. MIT 05-5293]TLD80532.1 glycosyltransferase family 2 protein [Helicobacter sp. MIT 05-5293]